MSAACVIFDLDGTLVDSEKLGSQGYLDLIPEITDTLEEFYLRYRGGQMAANMVDIERRFGLRLPKDFEATYRSRVAELFEQQLQIVPGVHEMLASVTLPKCVASNGPLAKMRHTLALTGIAGHFGGHLYSAYEVGSWKPDPGLFLHAARAMGFAPERCIVVEDSEVGVRAARAAGMKAVQFLAHGHTEIYAGATSFSDMARLPAMLEEMAASLTV